MYEQGEDEYDSNNDEPDPLSDDEAIPLENELPYAENYDLANPEPTGPNHTSLSVPATLIDKDKSVSHSDFSADAEEELLYSRRLHGYDLTDTTYETWLNTHQPTSANCRPTFSAAEDMLYARRYEEGYDLSDPKYETWLNIHHPNAEITSDVIAPSPITDVIASSPLTEVTPSSSITGLHGSLNITPVDIQVPAGLPTDACSASIAHSSSENVVTPVCSVSKSYPTQLKFSVSTKAHEPSSFESFKPGTPNSARSSLSSEEKRSPLANWLMFQRLITRRRRKLVKLGY